MFGFGKRIKHIDTRELAALLASPSPPKLIDVREPEEFSAGHVPGAVNVPLATLAEKTASLDVAEPIVLICRSGHRSLNGARSLSKRGFTQVSNVRGGTLAWRGPLER